MKKLLAGALILTAITLASCFETETNTQIKADGSGVVSATVDMSQAIDALMAMSKEGKQEEQEDVNLDTVLNVRNISDTSSLLTENEKRLLRNQSLHLTMVMGKGKASKMIISLKNSFDNLDDLTKLTALMQTPAFDKIFNKSLEIPGFSNGEGDSDADESDPADNLMAFISPDFFTCSYKKGEISCSLDSDRYKTARAKLGLDAQDENTQGMMEVLKVAKFTNVIAVPGKIKSIEGTSMKEGDEQGTISQSGSMSDLLEHPENYVYHITYK